MKQNIYNPIAQRAEERIKELKWAIPHPEDLDFEARMRIKSEIEWLENLIAYSDNVMKEVKEWKEDWED